MQFAPAVGVLAAVWRHRAAGRGRTGLAADVRIDRAAGVRMVAALSVPAMLVAVWLLMPAFGSSAALAGPMMGGPAIIAVLVWFALGCVGEELGWRCWLQPILQKRIGLIGAAGITGIAWGARHVQIFSAGLGYASGFLMTCVALSVLMAMLLEPLRSGRLRVAATFHCSLNLMLLIWTGSAAPSAGQQWVFAGSTVRAAMEAPGGSSTAAR